MRLKIADGTLFCFPRHGDRRKLRCESRNKDTCAGKFEKQTRSGEKRSSGPNTSTNVPLQHRSQSTNSGSHCWVCTFPTRDTRTNTSKKVFNSTEKMTKSTKKHANCGRRLQHWTWSQNWNWTPQCWNAYPQRIKQQRWLVEAVADVTEKVVALNTMHKKTLEKQVTYRTPKGAEKQLDYILVNRKYLRCSKDAEANDMIHMGSDHRCVMAHYVIPAPKKRTPKTD